METSARSRGFSANSGIQAAMKPREIDLTKLRLSLSKDFADPVKLESQGPFDRNKYAPIIVEDTSDLSYFEMLSNRGRPNGPRLRLKCSTMFRAWLVSQIFLDIGTIGKKNGPRTSSGSRLLVATMRDRLWPSFTNRFGSLLLKNWNP